MDLVVAEKPSVARDLARVLGVPRRGDWFENDRYAITWCVGHLVELVEPATYDAGWKPWRLDVLPMLPAEFRLQPASHAKDQLRTVRELLRDRRFAGVINGCDAGREGELIFRYVYQYAKSRLPVRRLWISSLTDDAIRRGFQGLRPGRELDALADAARSRSEADWLVGMNATRALTVVNRSRDKESALLSIGRVQTPTLALIVAREQEIRAFVPRAYWEVCGELRTQDGAAFEALWRSDAKPRLASAELAAQVVARDTAARGSDGPRVVAVRSRTVREPPPQLFDLTSLQRTANRRFGWAAARTLELAQSLYERHKVITYPRTDSRHLSSDVAGELPGLFAALALLPDYAPFAQQLVANPPKPGRRIVDDTKVSDHHAIIPTGTAPRSLDRDEARLFDVIVRRFLGAFFPDAEIAITEAWIRVCAGEGAAPAFAAADREHFVEAVPPPPDHYLARGRVRVVAGWQEVAGIEERRPREDRAGRERDDEPTGTLPPLVEGQRLAGTFSASEKQTTPPPRYSEATLLAAMESAGKAIDDEALREAMKDVGLGTPATRAAIIETLLRREFVIRSSSGTGKRDTQRNVLVPTDTGIHLIDALAAAKVSTLASPELTGTWEARLARIARGEEARAAFMADIERYVTSVIDALRGSSAPSSPRPPRSPPASPPSSPPRTDGSTGWSATDIADAWRSFAGVAATAGSDPGAGARTSTVKASRSSDRAATSHGKAPRRASAKPTKARAVKTASGPVALACPRCQRGHLIEGNRGWGCDRWREGCQFVIWYETAGRRLTDAQLRSLITTGKTRKATFTDARGASIEARLVLDPRSDSGVQLQRAR